jgi:hypothetical protein
MFDTAMLGVAIALVFTYLTLALALTAITEAINQWLSLRSNTLRDAVLRLLDDKDARDAFFKHPLIRSLRESDDAHPSYIPSELFTRTLLDMAAQGRAEGPAKVEELKELLRDPASPLPEQPRLAMLALLDDSVQSLDEARSRIGGWFDATMERASGWYRRIIQRYTRYAALLLVVAVDADTLAIARATWADDALRHQIVARAESVIQQGEDGPAVVRKQGEKLEIALAELQMDELPLGWSRADLDALIPGLIPRPPTGDGSEPSEGLRAQRPGLMIAGAWLSKIAGLLVSAAAVSLGAPFWFDLLNRLTRVRAAIAPRDPAEPRA